jgi:hypothetical protein
LIEKNYKRWNCNKKINLENHLKQKNKNKKNGNQIREMKKLKEDKFENNFQVEIIHWNKRSAIKIRWAKSLEK